MPPIEVRRGRLRLKRSAGHHALPYQPPAEDRNDFASAPTSERGDSAPPSDDEKEAGASGKRKVERAAKDGAEGGAEGGARDRAEDRAEDGEARPGDEDLAKAQDETAPDDDDGHSSSSSEEDEIIKELLADSTLTEAQRSHRLVQRRREAERAARALAKTHRQKVDEFNNKLSRLPEHFDVPRVGPG